MKFTSNKVINLGSAAFRQWRSTHSHCQYIHGYNLTADITFECEELDDKNWCADFGGLKDLKKTLEYTFDHKLVVAGDDPHIDLLKMLDETGVAQVVVLPGGVGCERFAEFVLKTADTFIDEATNGRVRVKSVQINEHDSNFATCHREAAVSTSTGSIEFVETAAETSATVLEDSHGVVAAVEESPKVEDAAPTPNPKAAQVGPNNGTKTKGGWFEGTTWG
jgi:6-pyruvoyltetrahydropterin/6-carboxytetrahydropterin synthase